MRIHWMRALTAAAVLGAPALAMAQLSAARAQTFRERDKNHDGVLTQEEYGGHPGNFRAMDANGDRVLSFDEFVNRYRDGNADEAAQVPAPAPAPAVPVVPDTFATMDRNGNGGIDRNEWRSDLASASFARLDRNHDGVVTRDELANPLPVGSAEARFGELDQNNNGFLNRNEWRDESVPFEVVDRNRDDRVSIDEYVNRPAGYGYGSRAMEARFAQLDRNHNGVINRGEWRGERLSFDAVDRDGDNRIVLDEYVNQGTDGYDYGYGSASSGMEARFAQMDRNRDGIVSRSEWRDSTSLFRQVDRNNDGMVTLREYLNAPVVYETPYGDDRYGTSRSTQFRSLDRNGSGYVERREWPYDLTEFDRMDRNGDGRLSTYEYDSTQGTTQGTYEAFRRLDGNGDGVISRREWNGSAQTFADYDRNRDGVISRDEFLNYNNYNY